MKLRIIVTVNSDGLYDVRAANAYDVRRGGVDAEKAEVKAIRASRELMDEVYPEFAHFTYVVEAEVPVPNLLVVEGTVKEVAP